MTIRVALVQVGITDEEPVAERVDRVLAMTAEVAADHDLVVLPELWPIGAFAVDLMAPHAEPIDGPLVHALAEVAAGAGTWLFGGSFPECATGPDGVRRHYNTQVVHGPDGVLAGAYRKVHLFGFNGGETTVMSSGEDLAVVDAPLGPTGLATCYDLRFPELFRRLVDDGAEAFVLPAGWPERRQVHWQVLARARAVEDQAYLLACNEAGTHAGVPIAGLSMVIDPQGEVLAEAGPGEEVLSVEVDPARVAAWRGAFPALDDRRMG
ncbi:MAG: carbon-nitrogen family hydrolase [Candidatus Nanopelagicales bacterium]|jgi:predicted amidohydrolase|nr:carbon-nitrogen family hydrolase [Candidatus Nanopelagicales bacterium]